MNVIAGAGAKPRRDQIDKISNLCMLFVAFAWLGNFLYAVGPIDGALKKWSPALVAGTMIAFVILHGSQQWGRKTVLYFALTIFLVGWSFETIGVSTGYPFGTYQYGEKMWPFIGHVPVAVLPAYWVMAYICWSLALMLRSRIDGPVDRVFLLTVPVLSAIFMVLWDLSMDPLRAIAEQRWHWQSDGFYYGIPVTNFIGWFLVTWVMFQIFAALIYFSGRKEPSNIGFRHQRYWLSIPLMYLAFPMEYLFNPFFAEQAGVTADIRSLSLQYTLYFEVALITLITMVPVAMTGIARLRSIRIHSSGDGINNAMPNDRNRPASIDDR